MFSINLRLVAYWLFLLIFDTASHKINESGQKEYKIKLTMKRKIQFF
jgi:hypothetical protein